MFELDSAYNSLKKTDIKNSVEELLFCYQVDFFHLLSLLWSKSERKTTNEYRTFLLGNCISYIVKASIVSNLEVKQISETLEKTYKQLKSNFSILDADTLITMFNGEVDTHFSTVDCLALAFFLCEIVFGCTWKDALDTQNFDN